MALTITAKTSDFTIENATKDELAAAMAYSPKSKKAEMVAEAKALRDDLRAEQVRIEQEAVRLAQVEAEKADDTIKTRLQNTLAALDDIVEAQTKIVADWKLEVAGCPADAVLYCLDHGRMERAMAASEILKQVAVPAAYIRRQLDDRTHTWSQIVWHIVSHKDETLYAVLNGEEYECNSTSSVARIRGIHVFAAKQFLARLLTNIVKYFGSDRLDDARFTISGQRHW